MPRNLNIATLTNSFANISLGAICGRRTDQEANAPSFSDDFKRQLIGVFQTSEKELRELPALEQTLGSAWRDTLKGAIMRVQSNVHLLDKRQTAALIEQVNGSLGLSVNLPRLSHDCAAVIESLSTLLATLETQIGAGDARAFSIPKNLRDEVDSAVKVVKVVTTLVGNVDKARPSAAIPIILPSVIGLTTGILAVMKGVSDVMARIHANERAIKAEASATPQPETRGGVGAVDIFFFTGMITMSVLGLGTGYYNMRHRVPSLRSFTNALTGLESQLTGLEAALSDAKTFADYVNTAPRKFYASPSTAIRELLESDFPETAFDVDDEVVAAVEDVTPAVTPAPTAAATPAPAPAVAVAPAGVLPEVIVARVAPIPAPRTAFSTRV